ncbi:MAG: ATP-grasp domain-containing protein [Gammaproteobacteria bacterium]
MKIAVLYNRESQKVINLFGLPNRERYGIRAIRRIVNALRAGGHQVIAMESDKDLIDKLEEFMPRVLKGERPGMAFNLSYGIQGQARYTHVPGILEMVGIPYVGSGPLAHSLALDKVVAKMIFVQNGLPTPEFAVLQAADDPLPELEYPLIVKPKNEAVSMGIRIVNDDAELRDAAAYIFEQFEQPVLVERYIEGREINVGLLGNSPVEAFQPAELLFGEGGPNIYTIDDKKGRSGREIIVRCPAHIDAALAEQAQDISRRAFQVLGCFDCARVDMRIDADGKLYILEVNSLPSLGEHGSYVNAAEAMGLDFPALVNRLVEVASARYFGTPRPPEMRGHSRDPGETMFGFLTERRDRIERQVERWSAISSRTGDPVGIRLAADRISEILGDIGLREVPELSDGHDVWGWETPAGLAGGTLLLVHLDVPGSADLAAVSFRRDPEWLYGEGVGSTRAPLVMLEFALRALRNVRRLARTPLGVLCYADEGRDCVESAAMIRKAAASAARVLVLQAGNSDGKLVDGRRGRRRYRVVAEARPRRPGQRGRGPTLMATALPQLLEAEALSSRQKRIAVSISDLRSVAYANLLPHSLRVELQASYARAADMAALDRQIRDLCAGGGLRWQIAEIADRPPMVESTANAALVREVQAVAEKWDIPADTESSLLPSVAGLVEERQPVLCGLGPVADKLYTSLEAVSRISLVQRTLLLAQVLLETEP